MHICRCMTSDFMFATGYWVDGMGFVYDDTNLENGLMYAEDYLRIGVTHCPSEGFDLRRFAHWTRQRLAFS